MELEVYTEFSAPIRGLSLNALMQGKTEEVLAYMSAVRAWVETETRHVMRLKKRAIVIVTCFYPEKGCAVDSDNNATTVKAVIDGLKKHVLYLENDGLESVEETRSRSRIGAFRVHVTVLHPQSKARR